MLNTHTLMLASTLFISIISFGAHAQPPSRLFSQLPTSTQASAFGLTAHSGKMNPGVIMRKSPEILLLLPDGKEVTATNDDFEARGQGSFAWRGVIEGEADSRVVLTLHRGVIAGTLRIGTDVYEIRPFKGREDNYVIEKLDNQAFLDEQMGSDAVEADEADHFEADVTPATVDSSGNYIIDLLSLYSTEAEAAAGGAAQIEAHIQAAVDVANTAFIDSQINARYVLVHMAAANRSDSGSISTDLSWLRSDSRVASLRDQYAPDIVSLISESGGCGVGYLLRSEAGAPDYGFQVTGLTAWISDGLSGISSLPPVAMMLVLSLMVTLLTEIVANPIPINIFVPIAAELVSACTMKSMFSYLYTHLSSSSLETI